MKYDGRPFGLPGGTKLRYTIRGTTQLALTSVLGIALCASFGFGRAQAQDHMSKHDTHSDRTMQSDGMMTDDYNDAAPAAPGYPTAAPGSLDLNHWTDFGRIHMRSGSAAEARMDMRRDRDHERMSKVARDEDEQDRLPTTPSYPYSSPGALDLNHWSDITHKHMRAGSATETRLDKMRERDHDRMSSMAHEEEYEDILPMAPSYPATAPGALDLNHWTDLTAKHMSPGSATEERTEKRRMKHEKSVTP